MPPLVTEGFHHVTFVSSDARRTVAFYRDLLGLSLVKRTVDPDEPSHHHLHFGDPTGSPGTIVSFLEWPTASRGHWGAGGVHHLALAVEDEAAQLRWKRRLSDSGTKVTGPYDRGYFRSIYFQDPDGHILEIATTGPGYDIDEPPDQLGERFIEPPDERVRGHRDEERIRARTHPEPVEIVSDDMKLQGIHHVTGICDDIQAADRFYSEGLGLRLVKQTVNQDDASTKHLFWANYDGRRVAPRSSMTHFEWPGSSPRARDGTGQIHHIAFRARDDDELEAWREHLLSFDLIVTEPCDRRYYRAISMRAPDGLRVEIATDGPGFTVDEDSDALGESLCLPPSLEKDRDRIESSLAPL